MTDNFKPEETAVQLRKAAMAEMHDDSLHGSLLDTYARLEQNKLRAVASALEASNSTLSTTPRAEIHRVSGEVNGVSFTAGNLDFGSNEHKLSLINDKDRVFFAKTADDTTTIVGEKITQGKTQFWGPATIKETPSLWAETFKEVSSAMTGGLVGRNINFSIKSSAEGGLSLPSFSRSSAGNALSAKEGALKGSFLAGTVIAGGIEATELQLYDRLKDNHKFIADMIKPSAIEATIVGVAASTGASNMKIRLGLAGAAVIVGKLANAAVNEFKELTKDQQPPE